MWRCHVPTFIRTDAIDGKLPDYPRLRPGISLFEDGGNLIVRSTRGAFQIAPSHRDAMLRVVNKLDGTHDFLALLGGELAADAFYILRMLGWFAQSGLVIGANVGASNPSPEAPTPRLDGVTVILSHSGSSSTTLLRSFEATGATVRCGGAEEAATAGAYWLACPNGPDIAFLEDVNRAALKAGIAWLPIFPFGDAIVVGPVLEAGHGPCFRCFELRWLGASPSIALERAYLAHLRRGGWRQEMPMTEPDVACVAATAAAFLARTEAESRLTFVQREFHDLFHGFVDRHPLCDVCANQRPASDKTPIIFNRSAWFEPSVPLAEFGARIASAAEGPCALVTIVPRPPGGAPTEATNLPQVAVGRFALPEPEEIDGKQANWCHGSAARIEDARTLAIIEGLERYAGLCPAPQGVAASYASVAEQAILPTELPLFAREQYDQSEFPFEPFDPQRVVEWSWGYNLTRGELVLVPTAAAWYGRDGEWLGETSSGVAAHSGRAHALVNGALELIERDAFMIHWLHRLSPPLIDPAGVGGVSNRAQIRHVEEVGYTVRLAELTTDLEIPVFLALGFRQDRRAPALIVGAGASLDAGVALARAVKELYAATLNTTPLWTLKPPLQIGDVRCLEDHGRAYEHPDWLAHASFLWVSRRRVEPPKERRGLEGGHHPEAAEKLKALIAQLAKHGHDLIGVDIAPPVVERLSLRVVRAIVPGLQPLGFADRLRLGGPRLHEAPIRMGYRTTPTREEDLNLIPHCFP